MSTQPQSDKGAAFAGLIITSVVLFLFAYGVVLWTNARFAGHDAPSAEATTAH